MSPPLQVAHHEDVDLAYLDHGGSGGWPLLVVAGLGGGRLAYPAGFLGALTEVGFRVASYDPRDVGASTRFTGARRPAPWRALLGGGEPAYSAEDLTDDAVAVLDALGWDRASVFGMSFGGLVAQRLALRHPDRIASVTSMCAVPSDAGRLSVLRHLHLDFIRRTAALDFPATPEGDLETAVAVARLSGSPAYPVDERAVREALAAVPVEGVRDDQAQSRMLRAPWHGPRLRDLRAPTLVLHGDRDPVVRPSAARAIARAVPGAHLEIVPGLGHDLPAPLWGRFADRIRANADRRGNGPSGGW
ncbi:alpha/beta fold hydrolase [Actinomycetospora termitidis]|uniref:Alpha/beta hydrolase n=1 Tax=Actinomycetospora termitidis TaxID=3053470 RepID=A0ABT7MAW8_9PSEU|nr:alpha/beta hydrolase [Actinomycetospora sp. Odt1-22]MDL5157586.1 alpha/beta hydrolase [Actinomycetospora sp. Odt1-22]